MRTRILLALVLGAPSTSVFAQAPATVGAVLPCDLDINASVTLKELTDDYNDAKRWPDMQDRLRAIRNRMNVECLEDRRPPPATQVLFSWIGVGSDDKARVFSAIHPSERAYDLLLPGVSSYVEVFLSDRRDVSVATRAASEPKANPHVASAAAFVSASAGPIATAVAAAAAPLPASSTVPPSPAEAALTGAASSAPTSSSTSVTSVDTVVVTPVVRPLATSPTSDSTNLVNTLVAYRDALSMVAKATQAVAALPKNPATSSFLATIVAGEPSLRERYELESEALEKTEATTETKTIVIASIRTVRLASDGGLLKLSRTVRRPLLPTEVRDKFDTFVKGAKTEWIDVSPSTHYLTRVQKLVTTAALNYRCSTSQPPECQDFRETVLRSLSEHIDRSKLDPDTAALNLRVRRWFADLDSTQFTDELTVKNEVHTRLAFTSVVGFAVSEHHSMKARGKVSSGAVVEEALPKAMVGFGFSLAARRYAKSVELPLSDFRHNWQQKLRFAGGVVVTPNLGVYLGGAAHVVSRVSVLLAATRLTFPKAGTNPATRGSGWAAILGTQVEFP